MSAARFRIAFSFAGEKRDFVEKVADILAQRFGQEAILYDKYHEAEFARHDLGIYLPNLYNRDSDLVVVVVCPNYDVKEWTGLEWLAIHDLLQQRRREEVMLCRFDRAQVNGLFRGAGFIELDTKTPEQFASLILERLARNEGKPRDHYTKPPASDDKPDKPHVPHYLPRLDQFPGHKDHSKNTPEDLDPKSCAYDFFISYTSKDEAWGEWLAWQLRERGYTFRFQKWHFRPGNSWVAQMQKALQQCKRMIAVLSPDYLKSQHGQAEWNVFYAKDPDGSKTLLIPVRVAKVELTDLHSTRNYIDFVDKSEAKCLEALLHGLKPMSEASIPAFPGSLIVPPPSFPNSNNSLPITPNNLPRAQCFFGRAAELRRIAEALSPDRRIWGVLIHGPGGHRKNLTGHPGSL
jgi:hypothetical protein